MTSNSVHAKPGSPAAPRTLPHRRQLQFAVAAGGGLILLAGGLAAGITAGRSAIPGYQHQVARLRVELATDHGKITDDRTRLRGAQAREQAARAAAQNALATARRQVLAQYRTKLAALGQQQSTLAAKERLNAELGRIQASKISADGVYVIGQDITGGTWHTSGGGGGGGFQCYYALLASDNTSDIIDNNNFSGPETVSTAGAHALEISGGCTWVRVS